MADVTDPELSPPPHQSVPQDRRVSTLLVFLAVLSALPVLLLVLIVWGSLQGRELGWFANSALGLGLPGLLALPWAVGVTVQHRFYALAVGSGPPADCHRHLAGADVAVVGYCSGSALIADLPDQPDTNEEQSAESVEEDS